MGKATKSKRQQKAIEPGRTVLPEDRLRDVRRYPPLRRPKREAAPQSTETGQFSLQEVENRVLRGMKTLRAQPDHERRFLADIGSGHPQHVQDLMDAYGSVEAIAPKFRPTPADVSQYLQSLSWVRHLPRHQWQLIWWRSFDLSFGTIARNVGQSDETARRRYREAITDVWAAANGL